MASTKQYILVQDSLFLGSSFGAPYGGSITPTTRGHPLICDSWAREEKMLSNVGNVGMNSSILEEGKERKRMQGQTEGGGGPVLSTCNTETSKNNRTGPVHPSIKSGELISGHHRLFFIVTRPRPIFLCQSNSPELYSSPVPVLLDLDAKLTARPIVC